jgi:hypothetical protein
MTIQISTSLRLLLIVLAVVLAAPAYAQDLGQPNVVLVFMDNFGYGELGVYGGGITRGGPTPRIDQLAAEDWPAAREAASLLLEELAAAPPTRGRNAARDQVQDFLAEAEGELAQGHR